MRTVNEVSKLTGVSVRTLHHYDAIGLLKPTKITEAGYRLYDDAALGRLQSILLFRELQFPLKEIKEILECPEFDRKEALKQQIQLLEMQQQHIQKLIDFAHEIQRKGVNEMKFDAFDKSKMEQYKDEVKEKWGKTQAYQEYAKREKTGQDFGKSKDQMMSIFTEIGSLKHLAPESECVQEKVRELQNFITSNYYTCTKEILKGLGEMYVADERFQKNIDKAGGEGTAAFARKAILSFCSK